MDVFMIIDKTQSADDLWNWMITQYLFAWLDMMEYTPYARYRIFAFGNSVLQLWPLDGRLGFQRSGDTNLTAQQVKQQINTSFWAASVGGSNSQPHGALNDAWQNFLYNRSSSTSLMRAVNFYDNMHYGGSTGITMLDGRLVDLGVERKMITRCRADTTSTGVSLDIFAQWATNGTADPSGGDHGGLFDTVCHSDFGGYAYPQNVWFNYSSGTELVREWWSLFSC
jgi:hypothetical protein